MPTLFESRLLSNSDIQKFNIEATKTGRMFDRVIHGQEYCFRRNRPEGQVGNPADQAILASWLGMPDATKDAESISPVSSAS